MRLMLATMKPQFTLFCVCSSVNATSLAVSGLPSENLTPLRSASVCVRPPSETVSPVASQGWSRPCASVLNSPSVIWLMARIDSLSTIFS